MVLLSVVNPLSGSVKIRSKGYPMPGTVPHEKLECGYSSFGDSHDVAKAPCADDDQPQTAFDVSLGVIVVVSLAPSSISRAILLTTPFIPSGTMS